jgi:endoglucanase
VSRQEAFSSLVLINAPGNCDAAAGPRARPFREVYVVQLHVMSLARRVRYLARRGRYLACALGVAGLAAGTAVAVSPGVAQAASACQVSYTVSSDWGTGFTAAVTIQNTGSAITSWTLGYSYGGSQKLSQGWSGTWSQSGEAITVTNASWNGSLGTGASAQIGANFTYSGTNAAPTAFTLNGIACNGGTGPTPTPTPTPTTSPSSSPTPTPTPSPTSTASGPAPQLHVSGNKLVNASGQTVVLHGVDRSGTEYACVQGNGIFDGPNDQASITAMKNWGVTAVRVPLNEACWNAESYVNAAYAGTNYISAIKAYVSLLNANGMVAILDLHWTDGLYTGNSAGCSSAEATCQKPMPDAAQAIPFWTSVASTFKGNNAVIFDLFNEPYASRATGSTTTGWQCWLSGGTCPGISYQVAGMQSMVNAVRSTGATNVLMLGGEEYSNDLTSWLAYEPTDPDHNLVASWHSYNFNTCSSQSCWTSQVAPVAAAVPVVAGEIGENDCADSYVDPLMTWLDSQGISYLAWAWNADFACSSGPGLITDYTGTPTAYGAGVETHLQSLPGG